MPKAKKQTTKKQVPEKATKKRSVLTNAQKAAIMDGMLTYMEHLSPMIEQGAATAGREAARDAIPGLLTNVCRRVLRGDVNVVDRLMLNREELERLQALHALINREIAK